MLQGWSELEIKMGDLKSAHWYLIQECAILVSILQIWNMNKKIRYLLYRNQYIESNKFYFCGTLKSNSDKDLKS